LQQDDPMNRTIRGIRSRRKAGARSPKAFRNCFKIFGTMLAPDKPVSGSRPRSGIACKPGLCTGLYSSYDAESIEAYARSKLTSGASPPLRAEVAAPLGLSAGLGYGAHDFSAILEFL
jgi:hypothetical protein